MPAGFNARDRIVKAAIVLFAALAPLGAAMSCATTPPAPDPDSGRNGVCGDGLDDCGPASCRNLDNDALHCGQCGNACQAGQECRAGGCECFAPLVKCGSSCIDLGSSPQNCGACGTVCAADRPFCSQSACSESCAAGLTACGTACIVLATDALNCGSCGAACGAGQACANSACVCTTAGQQLCGGQCVDVPSRTAQIAALAPSPARPGKRAPAVFAAAAGRAAADPAAADPAAAGAVVVEPGAATRSARPASRRARTRRPTPTTRA